MACVLLAVAATTAVSLRATPQYQTSVKFFVSTPSDTASNVFAGGAFSLQRAKSYADILAGPATAGAVDRALPDTARGATRNAIAATVVPDTVLLDATITDSSPQRALQIARAVARTFPDTVAGLEGDGTAGTTPVRVSVVEQPTLPADSFSPTPLRNAALAAVLGLLLGIALSVLRESMDKTVKTTEDVREVAGQAVLGTISFDEGAVKRPLILQDSARSPRAEAFRQLRTNLAFLQVDGALRSFVLTSSVPKEGKSTTACNLAITLAQAGVRVCLVEGDLRRPRVADYLGMEGAVGLTSVLVGNVSLQDAIQPWGDGTLEVLLSGPLPPNPSELLSSRGMTQLMQQLESSYDIVIVDAPPLLPVTDGAILASITGGAVLTVRAGVTRRDQLAQATQALRSVDASVLGVVLSMVPAKGPDAYGGYGYGSYANDPSKPQLSREDAVRALDLTRLEGPVGAQDRTVSGSSRVSTSRG